MMRDRERNIPLVVGVTGHRVIRPQDRQAIAAAVKGELVKLQERCPHSPLVMLSSLAEGGDLLCADAAAELGIPLVAALPRQLESYEQDFSPDAKERLAFHCGRAEQVFVAPFTEAEPENGISQDFQYRQAGIYVAAHSHVLLALWDGGPGTAAACGTAEAVGFALRGDYFPAAGVSLRSDGNEAVIHVFTPRGERTEENPGTVHILGDRRGMEGIIDRTEEFNRLSADVKKREKQLVPADRAEDPALERMEKIYCAASSLSAAAAKQYRLVLALLAVASTILTMAFLLYDEAQLIWMIFVCGAMLICAFLCQRHAARSACHRHYIEYRALAECLRVQGFLRYAGSGIMAADLLSWTQQEETAWIMDALYALSIGKVPQEKHDIRGCWVDEQRKYHLWAEKRALRDTDVSDRVVRVALILSIAFYCAAVCFELLCGGQIRPAAVPVKDAEWYRTLLKLVLGCISAVTLFIANYYGKLSLPRQLSDHQKMARFYGKMGEQLTLHGQTEELLTVLAREELIENGNWSSYQRDNAPDLSL